MKSREHGKTVLAVDDDPVILDYVVNALTPMGYRLLPASCAEEALRIAEAEGSGVDLLLTDVVMPGVNGQDLAQRFLDKYPDTKVLFMSAYMCPSMGHQDVPDSEKAFLLKPFTPDDLARKLKKIMVW